MIFFFKFRPRLWTTSLLSFLKGFGFINQTYKDNDGLEGATRFVLIRHIPEGYTYEDKNIFKAKKF